MFFIKYRDKKRLAEAARSGQHRRGRPLHMKRDAEQSKGPLSRVTSLIIAAMLLQRRISSPQNVVSPDATCDASMKIEYCYDSAKTNKGAPEGGTDWVLLGSSPFRRCWTDDVHASLSAFFGAAGSAISFSLEVPVVAAQLNITVLSNTGTAETQAPTKSTETTVQTTTGPVVGYLDKPSLPGHEMHLCCNYNDLSPRSRDPESQFGYNGFKVTVPVARNASALVDAGCSSPSEDEPLNFPREFTKEFAACDFCACLWYYGAPARQRCCSVKEFGMAGVDPDTGWEYCTELYHVITDFRLESASGDNSIHICELFYDIYPFQALSNSRRLHSANPALSLSLVILYLAWLLCTTSGPPLRHASDSSRTNSNSSLRVKKDTDTWTTRSYVCKPV
ncbi:unnamed protein product [Amoebophrya sp. A25]|nr:unnamed protein product [Amoebophrya sp. A25]|eukprot:GSA25T00002178001.1